jgi:hypothetical protein
MTRKLHRTQKALLETWATSVPKSAQPHAAIVGTFDVSNFGDLLFPLLAEHELGQRIKGVDLARYSYRSMDARLWPYAVRSLGQLASEISDLDLLLVGGGHLVRFDKLVAPGYEPTESGLHHPTSYWLAPTLLALGSGVPVAWNGLGVSADTPSWARRLLALALENTSYISVRDGSSAGALQDISSGARVHIIPDTAFGVRALLPERPSAQFTDFCAKVGLDRPYVLAQSSRYLLEFKPQLTAAIAQARSSGCHILELPISPVLGDSPGVLGLDGDVITSQEWPGPLLIAELIANAEAVIAQSLHLTIVALATGVPVHRPRSHETSKYRHIEHISGVHLWDPGVDAGAEMKQGLGRKPPGVRITEMLAQLTEHWDRIAELATHRSAPRPGLSASVLNLCICSAEENSSTTAPSEVENGHASSSSSVINQSTLVELNQRLQQADARTAVVATESAALSKQLKVQAEQIVALRRENEQLSREISRVAAETKDQLQRQEGYYALIARVRSLVRETLPAHSTVLVVSNGDDQFISFNGHTGWHFPRTETGLYAGQHPANGAAAIAELDKQRFKGAQYLLFPEPSFWWFTSYTELTNHLQKHYRLVLNREDTCKIYSLRERS